MNDQLWRFIALLGAVTVAIGIYLGLATITVPAINIVQNCGSAFSASTYRDGAGSLIVAECDSQRQHRETLSVVLIFAGVAVGGYGFRQSSLGGYASFLRPTKDRIDRTSS